MTNNFDQTSGSIARNTPRQDNNRNTDRTNSRPPRINERPHSGRSGGNSRSRVTVKKTAARANENPHFMEKRHVIDRDEAITITSTNGGKRPTKAAMSKAMNVMRRGNLADGTISPHLNKGPALKSNSAPVYADGPIVRIIPLGGVNEVGMNMTLIECGNDIVIIDTGMGFGGGEKFPGVDYIIPDTAYLEQNRHKIRGLIYTHAHLDHIGAAPYVLPKLGQIPIFGMPLTLALLKNRMQEFQLEEKLVAKVINPNQSLQLGCFKFEFFRLNHSIPDVVGLDIQTPMGRIAYCTDWKFDNTPYDGQISDYGKLAKMGDEGVRLLLTDSLGVLKPGYQISEKVVGQTMMKIFENCEGRIIVTSFSTTVSRMQFAIDSCLKFGRKLALSGRSMVNNFRTCYELGYLKVPPDLLIDFLDANKLPPEKVCLLCTGSQGEDMAALSRMARDEHDQIKLMGGDAVIFSSNPIPGNESSVQDLVALLSRKGVQVYNNKEFQLHVSGHACQEDLKLLIALNRPDFFQPIHGDHFMLHKLGELAASMGVKYDHNLIGENGRITELRPDKVVLTDDIVTENYILVEGAGVGAVSEAVLVERRQMATQGSINLVVLINKKKQLIAGPEIISRGFVYIKSSGDLFDEIKEYVREQFPKYDLDPNSSSYFSDLRNYLRTSVSSFVYKKLEKDPMIIPIVVQV